jgi:hypothetical protein
VFLTALECFPSMVEGEIEEHSKNNISDGGVEKRRERFRHASFILSTFLPPGAADICTSFRVPTTFKRRKFRNRSPPNRIPWVSLPAYQGVEGGRKRRHTALCCERWAREKAVIAGLAAEWAGEAWPRPQQKSVGDVSLVVGVFNVQALEFARVSTPSHREITQCSMLLACL